MTDPLDVLRGREEPVAADAAFATRLRARIARALDLPRGVAVSTTLLDQPGATPTAQGGPLSPYLAVADAPAALDWYVDVLGARLRGEPIVMPDGRIGHAELAVGTSVLMLADEHPEIGHTAPTGAGSGVSLHWEAADTDAVVARARAAGARITREPEDQPYGRQASLVDPFGHRWILSGPVRGAAAVRPAQPRHGDLGYASLWVGDGDRAAAFFSRVLGWQTTGGDGRYQVEGLNVHHGIFGGSYPGDLGQHEHPTLLLVFAVTDVDAAVVRARELGGEFEEPHDEPYGRLSDGRDPSGARIALYTPPGGVGSVAPPANGERAGDLAYVTIEVPDAEQAKAFYGALLGWQFEAGHVPNGWQITGPAPMSGLAGGAARPVAVPMYRVDDVAAAVARVRAAGGTADEPQRQPYGVTSTCTDDQGTRFYLGEL